MNPLTLDRQTIAKALEATGYKVIEYPSEIISPKQIIFDSTSATIAERFGQLEVLYKIQVVMGAIDAKSSMLEAEKLTNSIYNIVTENDLADLEQVSEIYNFTDTRTLLPAFTITLKSTINMKG